MLFTTSVKCTAEAKHVTCYFIPLLKYFSWKKTFPLLNVKIIYAMFKPFVTNIILVLPTTDLPRVNPQCQFTRQSQVTVLNPTLFAGPKELWILPVKPVHSDAPAEHTKQFF